MMTRINHFPDLSTSEIAIFLLGKVLCLKTTDFILTGMITETEAYTEDDPASHTFGGRQTLRNQPMFRTAGTIYIYLIYGMHRCLNIATGQKGEGSAVLIRALKPLQGQAHMQYNRGVKVTAKGLTDGPGKLVQALGIPMALNGASIFNPNIPLWLEDHNYSCTHQCTTRIGIRRGQDRLWRFVVLGDAQK
jgi:DNA-3-methyladenine glycosylase